MRAKSDAHETLSLMSQRDGVPPIIIIDGLEGQTFGNLKRKCQDASSWIKQNELYSPWNNADDSTIKNLKNGNIRRMFRAGAPKRL